MMCFYFSVNSRCSPNVKTSSEQAGSECVFTLKNLKRNKTKTRYFFGDFFFVSCTSSIFAVNWNHIQERIFLEGSEKRYYCLESFINFEQKKLQIAQHYSFSHEHFFNPIPLPISTKKTYSY